MRYFDDLKLALFYTFGHVLDNVDVLNHVWDHLSVNRCLDHITLLSIVLF